MVNRRHQVNFIEACEGFGKTNCMVPTIEGYWEPSPPVVVLHHAGDFNQPITYQQKAWDINENLGFILR